MGAGHAVHRAWNKASQGVLAAQITSKKPDSVFQVFASSFLMRHFSCSKLIGGPAGEGQEEFPQTSSHVSRF